MGRSAFQVEASTYHGYFWWFGGEAAVNVSVYAYTNHFRFTDNGFCIGAKIATPEKTVVDIDGAA